MPDDAPAPADVLDHLDALYALARVLTPDASAATDLVQATIRQALGTEPPANTPPRVWYTRLLLNIHADDPLDTPSEAPIDDLRSATADALVDRLLPTAFLSRPHRERLLLTLCVLNDLSPQAAAQVLGTDRTTVEQRLDAARTHLWETLKASATPPERRILQEQSSPRAAADALPNALPDTLAQAPSSLRPAASALIQEAAQSAPRPLEEPAPSAADRSAARSSSRSASAGSRLGHFVRRTGAALGLILVAGLLAYLLSSMLNRPASAPSTVDLIERTVAQSEQATPMVSTRDPAEGEQYVRDQTGRALAAPQIKRTQLRGVGTVEIAPQVTLPAFFLADTTTGLSITAYVFDYAMLDAFGDRVALAADVRRALEADDAVEARTVGQKQVLIWRRRDDIYVAVMPESSASLTERIAPSS